MRRFSAPRLGSWRSTRTPRRWRGPRSNCNEHSDYHCHHLDHLPLLPAALLPRRSPVRGRGTRHAGLLVHPAPLPSADLRGQPRDRAGAAFPHPPRPVLTAMSDPKKPELPSYRSLFFFYLKWLVVVAPLVGLGLWWMGK